MPHKVSIDVIPEIRDAVHDLVSSYPRGKRFCKYADVRIEISEGLRRRVQDYARVPDEPTEFHGGLMASLALRLYNEYRNRDPWSALAIDS